MDLWDYVPKDWQLPLVGVQGQIQEVGRQLDQFASEGDVIVPAREAIFRALELAPQQVKVIIIGQDPYPNPDHAMGLSFSVPQGTSPLPPSLRNIVKEITDEFGSCRVSSGELTPWVDQGVLLLNRSLTTCAGRSGAHSEIGWRTVTEQVVRAILEVNPQVVGLLWGSNAQELGQLFGAHQVVETSHPSPLSAYRGFLGSRCFIETNDKLIASGQSAINW